VDGFITAEVMRFGFLANFFAWAFALAPIGTKMLTDKDIIIILICKRGNKYMPKIFDFKKIKYTSFSIY